MMNKNLILIAVFIVLLFSSCKKEKEVTIPAFQPVGYWKGMLFIHNAAILNKENGGSMLYLKIPNNDTASASVFKYDGNYTMTENEFRAAYPISGTDTLFLKTVKTSNDYIEGRAVNSSVPGDAFQFEFNKQ